MSEISFTRIALEAYKQFDLQIARAHCERRAKYRPSVTYSTPLKSIALGVHSSQSNEFNEMYREHGILGAHHEPDGTCVLESNQARNAVMRLRGVYDRDAGYSQWAGEAQD